MSDASDPYPDPGTDVLKNVPGLRNAEQCGAFETLNSAARIYEFLQNPVHGGFDVPHLKSIHRHISQDVFAWAGEFRTSLLGKAEHLGQPAAWFCNDAHIATATAGENYAANRSGATAKRS
jgi:fido (protein-threonine AMPylation protein)